jgi:hypothetical protein
MTISGKLSRAAIFLAAATLVACGTLGGAASAATSAPATSPPQPAPYPGTGTGSSIPPPIPGSTPTPADACTPYVDGDYAHVSSGDVSAHGWWYVGTCANQKTVVTIGLQEYFSNGQWYDEGVVGTANVYPGGGSANRAVARVTCASVVSAGWRSYVIVTIGTGASAYTTAQNIACRT